MERIGNAWIYPVDLKGKVRAFVCPCVEGFTVYVDINLPHDEQIEAAAHELEHIRQNDFEKHDVQEIEKKRHGERSYDSVRQMEDTADG